MHRREDLFGSKTEEFGPERWEGLRPGWGFLPFNGGLRICLGREYSPISAKEHTFQLNIPPRPRNLRSTLLVRYPANHKTNIEQFALAEASFVERAWSSRLKPLSPGTTVHGQNIIL